MLQNRFCTFVFQRKNIDSVMWVFLASLFSISTIFQVLSLSQISSVCFSLIILSFCLWLVLRMILGLTALYLKRKKKIIVYQAASPLKNTVVLIGSWLIIIVTVVNLAVVTIPNLPIYDYEYYLSVLLFMLTIFAIGLAFTSETHKWCLQAMCLIATALALFFVLAYVSGFGRVYMEIDTEFAKGRFLSMNYSNPNAIATVLVAMFAMLVLGIFSIRSWIYKSTNLALIAFILFLIWETLSRNAIVTVALIAVLVIVTLLRKKRIIIARPIQLLYIIMPFFIASLYIITIFACSQNPTLHEILHNVGVKTIDSRYDLWIHSLNLISDNIIFGNHAALYFGGYYNLHNYQLDILANYGLFPFLLFIVYLFYIVSYYDKGGVYSRKSQVIALCVFLGIIASGTLDFGILTVGNGIAAFSLAPLAFISYPFSKNTIDESNALNRFTETNPKGSRSILVFSDEYSFDFEPKLKAIRNLPIYYLLTKKPLSPMRDVGHLSSPVSSNRISSILYSIEIKRIIRQNHVTVLAINQLSSFKMSYNSLLKYADKRAIKIVVFGDNNRVLNGLLYDGSFSYNEIERYKKTIKVLNIK